MPFADRAEAGRRLAQRLAHLAGQPTVVLGLPRGGVPVGAQVADALGAPLDVILVRKLGVPVQPELAMGAIGEDGVRVINDEIVAATRVSPWDIGVVEEREREELERRARRFRGDRPRVTLDGRIAVIVDDGIATGSTAKAACQVARMHGARRVILAVPVAPVGWAERVGPDADECIAVETPAQFWAIGQFYDDFSATSDTEVVEHLERAATSATTSTEVVIDVDDAQLPGTLTVPPRASGVVVFAHGSGSSRHSTRNQYVANALQAEGLATVLFDLLTTSEESDRSNVFDIDLLARRLSGVTAWLRHRSERVAALPIGYFGASTGAAAALLAAADHARDISAVVSRGGRPDLAGPRLATMAAPTLLIVGGADDAVLELNRQALDQLRCEKRLDVVPGATHLFSEAGALETVATLAAEWFCTHLPAAG